MVSFFAALCLFLSAVEYALPKPIPFLRLGLANFPILISLEVFRRRDTLLLLGLKILGQGILTGTIFSYVFLFSVAGSFSSGFTMLLLHVLFMKKKYISLFGISVAGACANTIAQLVVARFILFGSGVWFIAPVFLAAGIVTGVLLGLFALRFMAESRWFKYISSKRRCEVSE